MGVAGLQFGRFEANDHLAGLEQIAFAGEDLFDTSAIAGSDASFINFDRAGDVVGAGRFIPFGAARKQHRSGQSQNSNCDDG